MRSVLLALALVGCSSAAAGGGAIDRTGFDVAACGAEDGSLLEALTLASPVDYLEWRSDWGGIAARGARCDGATDRPACEMAVANQPAPPDAWPATTSGGIPAPPTWLVYTRGDEVGAVGRGGLSALLAPLGPADAAFIAQAATEAGVPCGEDRLREVAGGGYEVILTRDYTCGGGQDELLVAVGEDGATTVLDTVTVSEGEDIICP